MNTRYIAPTDPSNAKRRRGPASLPRNALAGLPCYVRGARSKYMPGASRRDSVKS